MAALRAASTSTVSLSSRKALLPAMPRSVRSVAVRAQAVEKGEVAKIAATVAAASTALVASQAQAATEVSQLAAGDNRAGIIAALLLPAVGWVGFNILEGLQNQLNRMEDQRSGVAAVLGMGALSLFFAQNAEAATEVSQLAASDNRATIILSLLLPALGWVGFNIFEAFQNQLRRMDDERGVAGAVGLTAAASMFFAQSAEAATEVSQLAASDNRATIIAALLLPALGWVGFNIFEAFQNQLKRMDDERGVAGAVGLSAAASMFFAQSAEAATEVSQLAAGDNRAGIIAALLLPAVGWVGFNILEGFQNQLKRMEQERS